MRRFPASGRSWRDGDQSSRCRRRGAVPAGCRSPRRRAAARGAIAHRPPVAVSRRRPGQVHRWRSPGGARTWPYPRPTAVRHILPNVLRMAGDPAAATNTSPSLRPVRFTCSASATLTTSGSATVRNDVAVFESRRSGWERRHPRAHPLPPVDGAAPIVRPARFSAVGGGPHTARVSWRPT
jgi:hypothetical protein